jgi:uncharacterized protein
VLIGTLVVAMTVLSAGAAGAHVAVTPSTAPKGGFEILSFSVPNEKDDANTVGLEVEFPAKYPIPSVRVKPMTGWTIEVTKTGDAVSTVTWTATDGGLTPGQFDLFTVSAGPLPTNTKKLELAAVQTYSDGDVVSWSEPAVKGAPEPEHPAPTLTLTKSSGDHD